MNCSDMQDDEIPFSKNSSERRSQRTKLLRVLIERFIILQKKSPNCKHDDGCIVNIVSGAVRSFVIAFGVKSLFKIVSILTQKKKRGSFINYVNAIFDEDSTRFALFPTLYTAIQKGKLLYFFNNKKGVICSCRNVFGDDKQIYAFISGFLAGSMALSVLKEEKRAIWALYLLTRSLDTIVISMQNKGHIKQRSSYYVILFGLQKLVTGYAYGCESKELAEDMNKFYSRFGGNGQTEKDFIECWHEMKRRQLEK